MASIGEDGPGRWRVLFVGSDGKRRTVRLGKCSRSQAESFKGYVEKLAHAVATNHPPEREVTEWATRKISDKLRRRLVAAGLLANEDWERATLKALLDKFFATCNVKPGTATTYKQARKSLEDFFGEAKAVRSIDEMAADEWRQSMVKEGLAGATIAKRVKTARQFFKKAVRWKMADANPLADVVGGSMKNEDRQHYVDRPTTAKLLEACPDAEWRLIVALSRYGGLRCPSEHLLLKWTDVNWDDEKGSVRVTSPKTERYPGGAERVIPLFPELRTALMDVFDAAPEGATHCITRYRDRNQNLRTQMFRIIRRAGLVPWPRLFHNLRASCQTDLANDHPIKLVCEWIGNSEQIAINHYLMVTDDHFEKAVAGKAAQNPAQKDPVSPSTTPNAFSPETKNPPSFPGDSTSCGMVQETNMTLTGFEESAKSPGETAVLQTTGTPTGTHNVADLLAKLAALSPAELERIRKALGR